MTETIAICSTHKGLEPETLRSLKSSGVPYSTIHGVADTALARNLALTNGLREALKVGAAFVLMVDDDMSFDLETVKKLQEYSAELSAPCSAVYAQADGKPACALWKKGGDWKTSRWLTGLGLLIIPTEQLFSLGEKSQRIAHAQAEVQAFTWSGPSEEGTWRSEDYTLCERLGGVVLAPVVAGHIKKLELHPDPELIESLTTGTLFK